MPESTPRKRGRPAGATGTDNKEKVTLRIDADILAEYRASGPGWTSRMNQHLRDAIGLG